MSRLRILFLVSAHNGLSQRAWIELTELGHDVTVSVVDSAAAMETAVAEHDPQLIVCPILKKMIPESIWSAHRCLVVHPGPMGDRGPSSLDWAIELGMPEWGVTVLEATGDVDAGDVWATRTFRPRGASKSGLYRHEVRRAAIEAIVEAVGKVADGRERPEPLDPADPRVIGQTRPLMTQDVRAIDWRSDDTDSVVRKLRAAEGHPGVLDDIGGTAFHLFGVHRAQALHGAPGEIIAQRHGAICRATVDGAVWITELKRRSTPEAAFFKLPATRALALAGCALDVPEVPVPLHASLRADDTYREIAYEEDAGVGYLRFEFYNGAMSTEQCRRLLDAYRYARSRRETKVIVLMGGRDFFSNGIHLNVIEAADDPAAESWLNLHAIDDVVRAIVETDSHLVISALTGDAAAGGVPLALAADHVVAREDVVLNPYYRHMGGLYGSEYWTYLLPRRVGEAATAELVDAPFTPIGARTAARIGLLDAAFGATAELFQARTRTMAERLAQRVVGDDLLAQKRRRRARDEQLKPLQKYRTEELARSHECFFGPDRSYHEARRRFCLKLGSAGTVASRADASATTVRKSA
jgi:putative two-component system hydrogenase maturation factor HypX/HoxX